MQHHDIHTISLYTFFHYLGNKKICMKFHADFFNDPKFINGVYVVIPLQIIIHNLNTYDFNRVDLSVSNFFKSSNPNKPAIGLTFSPLP